jgi:hypothetical protein
LQWTYTPLIYQKTSTRCNFHIVIFDNYARLCLGNFCFRVNKGIAIGTMAKRTANAIYHYMCCTERAPKAMEACGQSRERTRRYTK